MSDNYGSYQTEIYGKGALAGILPSVTTDPRLLEEQAKRALGVRAFNYVAGGAGEKATMDSNRLAFRQWKLYVSVLFCCINHLILILVDNAESHGC